jgi:basic membrane protein A
MKIYRMWLSTLLLALPILVACNGVMAQPETSAEAGEDALVAAVEASPLVPAAQDVDKYGLVAGPIDDRGFNQLAWEGLQRAAADLGVEVEHLQSDADNAQANIDQLLNEGASGIVTVGFGLTQATRAASRANLKVPFVSVDVPSQTAGDLGLLFSTDEPAFMAGYLAAGMTESATVCTYGGLQTPPVLIFMVGFENGVDYFNEQNGTDIQVLGWDTSAAASSGGRGTFVDTFQDPAEGRRIAEEFFDQGCDIIFPVAGASGLGSAQAAQERGLAVIGVDADQSVTVPELADVYLTSVLKKIDLTVFAAVELIQDGIFEGGENFIGTLDNGGVSLAPFHDFEAAIPQQLKDDLAGIEQGIIDGSISTGWPIVGPSSAGSRLALSILGNTTYPSDWTADGTATLSNGEYREPAAPGSATETVVQLSNSVAFGDLDGDGRADAVVVLITDPGGSGTFYDLVSVLEKQGEPVPVASTFLGDRIELESLRIENGQVIVDMVTQGPEDAQCCPTQQETRNYTIQYSLGQAAGEVTATEVIQYVPTEVPAETQAGSCFANAIGLGREDAYRCTVDNQIYDPCFVVDEAPTVVCGANPTTGETGFVLELTEPLPAPSVGSLAQPWLVELADGTICGLMTGTVPVVDDRVAPYGCTDGTNLFEDFQQGEIWTAEQAVISLDEDGFFVEESEIVSIRTVWQ